MQLHWQVGQVWGMGIAWHWQAWQEVAAACTATHMVAGSSGTGYSNVTYYKGGRNMAAPPPTPIHTFSL